jgi:4-amino-4-deoxy-L-arabinose transferase-like glycosyltransferase
VTERKIVKCNCGQFLVVINKFGVFLTQEQIAKAGLTNEFGTDAGRVYLPNDVFLTTGHDADEVLDRVSKELSLDFSKALLVVTKFDELVYRGLVPTPSRTPRSVGKPAGYQEMADTKFSMTPKQAKELEASIAQGLPDDTAKIGGLVVQISTLMVEDLHEKVRQELAT